jgi:hypothetical protein
VALNEIDEDFSAAHANEVAMPGSYVTIYVKEVPSHILGS